MAANSQKLNSMKHCKVSIKLTENVITRLKNGEEVSQEVQPVFQVGEIRALSNRYFYYFFSLLIITELDVILPICDPIGNQRQSPITYGGEPPTSMYAPPVQSINQPTTMANPQNLTGSSHPGSVPRPKITANSPIYPHNQDHRAGLHSYGRWTIKARVTAKAELRHYNNAKGDGKVFSFDLLDATGGAVRITCFNAIADQFYDQIEAGKVYFVSKGSVKPAQKAFNHLKNDHEIMLDSSSTIQPCYDDDSSIPQQQFNLRQIAEIEGLDNISVLDIIGVVFRIFPTCIVKKKGGTETQKRNLHIKDMSRRSVDVTSWGNFCNTDGQILQNMCDSGRFPILAIKSSRAESKFGLINKGNNMPSISLSHENTDVRKTVSLIKEEKLRTSEKADWITVSGNVGFLKVDSFYYTACPLTINDRKCNKKATNNGDGKWRCDRCDKDVNECDYRYILQFQIQDHTGITWVTAFENGGEAIMGVTAKEETFDDDSHVKITVTKAEKINFSSETSFLLDMLKKDHPSSLVPMIEMPPAGSGHTPTGNFAYKESAPFSNYMGNASGVGRQSATLPASQMGQYGNQYRGQRVNSMNPGVGRNNGHRANDYTGVSNAVSAYGRGNAAQGRYGSASGQYVVGY
ncbi:replication protein A 70 kDa DNA-binding subunit A-like protein [Tanacetum coccineum]